MTNDLDSRAVAERLAGHPTSSTGHMTFEERADGVERMLADLRRLATQDGCIVNLRAVGWALEVLTERAADLCPDQTA